MKILVPIELTEYTTNIPESDYPTYSATATYALEDKVIAENHNIYESSINSNIGKTPKDNPDKWLLVGKTNAYKAIDNKVYTQTLGDGTFIFPTFKSTSLAFLNTQCTSITVEVLNGTEVIHSKTQSGRTRKTNGWYSYFFGVFEYKKTFIFEHLINPFGTYRVTVTGTECKVGVMIRGNIINLGKTQWNPEISPVDYSKYTEDNWGETYLKKGNVRLKARGTINVETERLSTILDIILSRVGELSLWILTENYKVPYIYGFVRQPNFVWGNPERSVYTLDIEGVI